MTAGSQKEKMNHSGRFWTVLAALVLVGTASPAIAKDTETASTANQEPPLTLIDDSVDKTVRVASERGWAPCPGNCLKLATPGWHHQSVAGHPDSDVWFTFRDSGGWCAYSQHHIGHIILTHSDRAAEDVGICPVCHGTGWVRKESLKPAR